MKNFKIQCPFADGKKIQFHLCEVKRMDGGRLMAICGTHGFRAFIPDLTKQAPEQSFDPINRPKHYVDRKFEPIDVIADNGWAEGFCLGNAYKYMARAGKKPGEPYDKDLKKAKWYLDFWVKAVEEKRVDVPALLKGPQG